jgi:apolipoprotein N-acyltransferase
MMPRMGSAAGSARRLLGLALLSGVLLGFSFPPVPTGILACVAFVPFFILFEAEPGYAVGFRFSYATFFVVNLITLYWTGGFTHGKDPYLMAAGASLLLAHPLFFYLPVAGWILLRKHFGRTYALCLFPFLWVAFEYLHSMADISFPWLTLGNTQTYDLPAVQMASLTGVYGITFWLLWLNVLLYLFLSRLRSGSWKLRSLRSALFLGLCAAVYLLPRVYGASVLSGPRHAGLDSIRVGVVQPNVDPFEKWGLNPERQVQVLQDLTDAVADQKPDLILWPETAVPFYLLDERNRPFFEQIRHQVDSLGIPLLTGIPDITYYREGDRIPGSSKISTDGRRYDNYNSSMLLQPHEDTIQKYAKMLLVPFAERVPFSEALSFLNAMQWNFGLGGWGIGAEETIFRVRPRGPDSARGFSFSNCICYESAYPAFVAGFVRHGAEFLTVITNDSWWGNTSGAYQHAQYAILRAVENRRWVVQCANGGISCAVDPYGRVVQPTRMFTRGTMVASIMPERALTFYSRTGDWFPEICLILSCFHLAASGGSRIYSRLRRREDHEPD